MASVGRRWARTHCPRCDETRKFEVLPSWQLRCPVCGCEKRLGVLRGERPEPVLAQAS